MKSGTRKGIFDRIAALLLKHYMLILLFVLCITVFFAFHGKDVEFESDISKEMPNNKEVFQKQHYFEDNFEGSQSIIISYAIDDSIKDNPIERITEQEVIRSIYELDGYLRKVPQIKDTMSLGEVFKKAQVYPYTEAIIQDVLGEAPSYLQRFISDDRKATMFVLYADNLDTKEDTEEFVATVKEKIERSNPPYGIKTTITGHPVLTADLQGYMSSDYYTTVAVALVLIFGFFLIITRNFKKSLLIATPLILGLIWYAGLISLLDLKLTISTIATGAMVLGLGVEYSIFTYNKFEKIIHEEENEHLERAVHESVGFTGKAIFGSAMTTTAAFLSLTFSVIPLLAHLGLIAAIGIVSIMINAIIVNPCIFILIEQVRNNHAHTT